MHDRKLRVGNRLLLENAEAGAVPATLHLILAVLVLRHENRWMALLENRGQTKHVSLDTGGICLRVHVDLLDGHLVGCVFTRGQRCRFFATRNQFRI